MLYGLVVNLTGGSTSRWGMVLLIAWSFTGLIYIFLALRYQKWIRLKVIEEAKLNQEVELQAPPPIEMGRSGSF